MNILKYKDIFEIYKLWEWVNRKYNDIFKWNIKEYLFYALLQDQNFQTGEWC